ncbi:MAG: DUF3035 domain-containing protein [Rhodobacteraceae bacterium]|nr:DUF3035 domain-containing protein [Paracoccaceae bacterium]
MPKTRVNLRKDVQKRADTAMSFRGGKLGLMLAAVCVLAGCDTTSGIGKLFAANSGGDGPDEFAILPTKPLEMPESLTTLPEPNLGGPNLVDPKPEHDGVAALGGRPERLDSQSTYGGEGALLAAATRFGIGADIRGVLAREDEKFRSKNGPKLFERWFKTDIYFKRYQSQTLNAFEELRRMRRIGAQTPTAPPPGENN